MTLERAQSPVTCLCEEPRILVCNMQKRIIWAVAVGFITVLTQAPSYAKDPARSNPITGRAKLGSSLDYKATFDFIPNNENHKPFNPENPRIFPGKLLIQEPVKPFVKFGSIDDTVHGSVSLHFAVLDYKILELKDGSKVGEWTGLTTAKIEANCPKNPPKPCEPISAKTTLAVGDEKAVSVTGKEAEVYNKLTMSDKTTAFHFDSKDPNPSVLDTVELNLSPVFAGVTGLSSKVFSIDLIGSPGRGGTIPSLTVEPIFENPSSYLVELLYGTNTCSLSVGCDAAFIDAVKLGIASSYYYNDSLQAFVLLDSLESVALPTASFTYVGLSPATSTLFSPSTSPPVSSDVEVVPAPLPLLGAGAAFGYSRKLRKRIKTSKKPEVISAIG
jgi:hypothetical protein